MSTIVALISNLGLLALAAVVFFVGISRFGWPQEDSRRHVLIGVVFGAMSVLVVNIPVMGPFGASFDTRAAPIVLAGYYGGPVGGLIAATIGAVARFNLGGPMAIGGSVSFFIYCAVGFLFCGGMRRLAGRRLGPGTLVLLSVLATIAVLPCFFIAHPAAKGWAVLSQFWHVLALGNVVGILVLGLMVEHLLSVAEERDRHMIEAETSRQARQAAGIGVWRLDMESQALSWDSVQRTLMAGTAGDSLHFEDFWKRVHEEDRDRVERAIGEAQRTGGLSDLRFRIRTPDGDTRHIRSQARFFDETDRTPAYAVGADIDETEEVRLRTEMALRSAALDAAACGVVIADASQGNPILFVNRGFVQSTGCRPDDILGRDWRLLISGVEDDGERERLGEAMTSGKAEDLTFRTRRCDGTPCWNRLSISPLADETGRTTFYIAIQEDVTELVDARLDVERVRDKLEAVFAAAPNAILTVDDKQHISSCNRKAEALFGGGPNTLIGRPFTDLIGDAHQDLYCARFGEYLKTGSASAVEISEEVEARRTDGTPFPILLSLGAVAFSDTRWVVASIIDLTDQKTVEQQLRRAQRMEAVGQLTGGVAHDFNNILVAITGNAELLGQRLDGDAHARKRLAAIERASDRAAALTNRLLAFSRQQTLAPRSTDVNGLIAGLQDMLDRTLGETIELKIIAAPDLWDATTDPHQFENALVNLAVNARDAMHRAGTLVIETANQVLDRTATRRWGDVAPGDYVKIAVSDNGHGMAPETLERVFEPFFTTKEVGKGSGLGLSMVYGFVKQSKGHVTVHSNEGQGTTVALYLPRAQHAAARNAAGPQETTAFPRGMGRILIVEDDPDVLKIPVEILTRQGYSIVQASDGEEAIDRFKKGETFDLLFTDVVLPRGHSGIEVAQEAGRLQPDIKILFTTGYSDQVLVGKEDLAAHMNILNKPYRRAELLKSVQDLLAG